MCAAGFSRNSCLKSRAIGVEVLPESSNPLQAEQVVFGAALRGLAGLRHEANSKTDENK